MPTLSSPSAKSLLQGRMLMIAFAVVAALLAVGYFLFVRQDYAVLYKDLRATDAAVIVAELDKQHVPYQLRDGGSQILVPSRQADAVRLAVVGADMPTKGLEGFELFNNSDLGLTDFGQKVKFQRAMQGELARTIMMTEGVVDARVHISMPDRALFREQQQQAKAAVTLVMRSPDLETTARIDGVRQLVAAAVPDLTADDVVVLDARGEVISPAVHPASEKPAAAAPSLAGLVQDVAEQTISGRRFEVSISHEPAPKAASDSAEAGTRSTPAPVQLRTSAGRTIQIATEAPLTPAEQNLIRARLGNADIIDPGDDAALAYDVRPIAVATAPPSPVTASALVAQADAASRSDASPPRLVPVPQGGGDPIPGGLIEIGLALTAALIVLAAGAFIFVRIRQSRSALSFEHRRRLVDQLKFDLQSDLQESRHGAA